MRFLDKLFEPLRSRPPTVTSSVDLSRVLLPKRLLPAAPGSACSGTRRSLEGVVSGFRQTATLATSEAAAPDGGSSSSTSRELRTARGQGLCRRNGLGEPVHELQSPVGGCLVESDDTRMPD